MKLKNQSVIVDVARRWVLPCAAAFVPWIAVAQDRAQSYPEKAVHIIVPFAAGGPADLLARAVGERLAKAAGRPFVVENKAGAAGNIGVEAVAKAAPDGYTIGLIPTGNIAVNTALMPKLPYKQTDLVPVTMLATAENVLVVNTALQVKSLAELLKLANQKTGRLTFASPGAGSQAHLAGELLQQDANISLIHVPYKGISPAMTDVIGGQVTMMFVPLSSAMPYIKAGKVQALAVASPKRSQSLPAVPTVAEQGFPKFEAVSWYALMAPAGTSQDAVRKLGKLVDKALADPELKERLATVGLETAGGTPEQLAATIQKESSRWAALIRHRQISAN